jgi:RHS repeat-associated protein
MSCRAPSSAGGASCAGGTNTNAQQLSYDNEGRLTGWQNLPSSPTSTAQYLYDGDGTRVLQRTTSGGTSTTTIYIGKIEAVVTTGGTTTTKTYYYAGSQRVALAVNGTISYLGTDLLGSSSVSLDVAGNVTASQLFSPYGVQRYSSGGMPTDYGFTGQRQDSASGLNYYGARYYDASAGQFTSADVLQDGLNRYGYVHGNPTSYTDPTGQFASCIGLLFNHSSGQDVFAGVGMCLTDSAIGAYQSRREVSAVSSAIEGVLAQYNTSGTYKYLTKDGVAALEDVTGPMAYVKAGLNNLKNPLNMLPGRGGSAADAILLTSA